MALAAPWAVFFLGWLAAGLLTPSGTDNTPILTHDPLDVERDLASLEERDIADHDGSTTELAGSR